MFTNFPSLYDVDAVFLLIREMGNWLFPEVYYKRLLTTADELEDVHGELPDYRKRWDSWVLVKGYVAPDEEKQNTSRFGTERVRNVTLQIAVPHLLEAALVEQDPNTRELTLLAGIGDRFLYSGNVYDVKEVKRGPSFANTDIPLYFILPAEKVREESTTFANI